MAAAPPLLDPNMNSLHCVRLKMSKHIKTLLAAAVLSAGLSGFAHAAVAPTAAALLLHGQTANNAMTYSTKVPCPDPSATSAAHPGAAKPHKIAAHPHPKPKPKLQPAAAVHDGSEPAAKPVKKVVHIKRKPKPKPSFVPLALAANKARMSPIPVAANQSLLSRPADPGILCEAIHRGDPVGPTLVSNPETPAAAPSEPTSPLLAPSGEGLSAPFSEAAAPPSAFSEPFNSGPNGIGGGGGPPGAIGSQAQNPPGSGGGTPPTETAPISPIPEPSDWALMMFGLGAIGYGLRAQRRAGRKNREGITA